MSRATLLSAGTSLLSLAVLVLTWDSLALPTLSTFAFWVCLFVAAELLPVSLGFQTQVSMSFPIALAIVLLFEPPVAMIMLGLGNFDARELRREISISQSVFNRAQTMLAAAAASNAARLGG